jgi:hypothetical protein
MSTPERGHYKRTEEASILHGDLLLMDYELKQLAKKHAELNQRALTLAEKLRRIEDKLKQDLTKPSRSKSESGSH